MLKKFNLLPFIPTIFFSAWKYLLWRVLLTLFLLAVLAGPGASLLQALVLPN